MSTIREWLHDFLPTWAIDWLRGSTFDTRNWQWTALLLIAFVGVIVDRITIVTLRVILNRVLNREKVKVDAKISRKGLRPFGLLAMTFVWGFAVSLLDLPEGVDSIIGLAIKVVGVGACVWGVYRLVDVLGAVMVAKARTTESKFDDLLIPLVRKSLKVFIAAFGIVFIASNIPGLNIQSLLAGLGIGGLAFALAAKDTVENLFGSFTAILDRPFQVGDWVVVDGVEGTVEEVGFRSTRIRTFYNSLVSIPNAKLISANVDNFGRRKFRRWKTSVGIAYETPPEKIEAFCEGIRELVRLHPYTRKDYFHVYLNAFAGSSLDILLYIFHETADWSTELRERHRLMLDIIRLAHRLGVNFAYPTQTLYMNQAAPTEAGGPLPELASIRNAEKLGRREAMAITRGELGGPGVVPPPVDFQIPPKENRGESE